MAKKKTVDVKMLVEFANTQLARKDSTADIGYKIGICNFIEKVLMETGNYEGYMYLDDGEIAFGSLSYFSRKYFCGIK